MQGIKVVSKEFSYAHFIENVDSPEALLHGHTSKIVIWFDFVSPIRNYIPYSEVIKVFIDDLVLKFDHQCICNETLLKNLSDPTIKGKYYKFSTQTVYGDIDLKLPKANVILFPGITTSENILRFIMDKFIIKLSEIGKTDKELFTIFDVLKLNEIKLAMVQDTEIMAILKLTKDCIDEYVHIINI